MIARIWRGAVRTADAEEYVDYIAGTGLAEYKDTPGNRGAWMLTRPVGDDRTEVITFSLWDSLDAVKAFAGEDYETAVYYPEDERYLVAHDDVCAHYDAR
jgi:heme-degrading monooxygenase HmoA